jgi:membrane protein required for colicin V production
MPTLQRTTDDQQRAPLENKRHSMNILDFILLTILAIAIIRGLIRGMIRQVASLLGLIAGFVVAGHLYLRLVPVFKKYLPSLPYLEVFTYLAVYTATWLTVVLLGYLFVKLSRAMLMAWADRLLGGILGFFKGLVTAVILVAVLTLFISGRSPILTDSLLCVHVQRVGYYFVQLTPKDLRKRYKKRHETLVRRLEQEKITESIKKKMKK